MVPCLPSKRHLCFGANFGIMFLNIVSFALTTHVSFYGNGVEIKCFVVKSIHTRTLYICEKGHF